jgi:hypothetical protein
MNPFGIYQSGNVDHVSMGTQRVSLRIPLVVDQSQGGKLKFSLESVERNGRKRVGARHRVERGVDVQGGNTQQKGVVLRLRSFSSCLDART